MYVQPNKMLQNTSRVIKPYNCSFIATEGPNILGKIDLAGVESLYETQFTSRLLLNPNAQGQPLLYGFLGNDVTFLLLKITYDSANPYCLIEENEYIEYYFGNDTTNIKYISKLMLLTGNSTKRIPQIYLNNPTDFTVVIDVMVGNLSQPDINSSNLNPNNIIMKGLYHNNIISDVIYNATTGNDGSTQFAILDYEGNISLYLNYNEIETLQIDENNNQLVIQTKSDSVIYLEFLSRFEMYQANSRMLWVIDDSLNRKITTELPSVDSLPPTITMSVGVDPIIDYIYTISVTTNNNIFTVLPQNIIDYFILSVYDDVDGEISKNNLNIQIRKYGELLNLTKIEEEGGYDILLSIMDNANNTAIMNFILVIDVTKPVITFKSNDLTINMSLSEASNPLLGISKIDITTKTVASKTDNIDTILPNLTSSDLSNTQTIDYILTIMDINDVEYTDITTVGEYYLTYSVTDLSGNFNLYTKTLVINN